MPSGLTLLDFSMQIRQPETKGSFHQLAYLILVLPYTYLTIFLGLGLSISGNKALRLFYETSIQREDILFELDYLPPLSYRITHAANALMVLCLST